MKTSKPSFRNEPSFGGRIGIDGTRLQRYFKNLPCPCCGIKMLNSKDMVKFIDKLEENAASAEILPKLKKFEGRLHPVEDSVLQILKDLSEKYPKKTLRQLLDLKRRYQLRVLHKEQEKIIERIRLLGYFISEKEQKRLEKTLHEAEKILKERTGTQQFKRRVFVGKIKHAVENVKEKDVAKAITLAAEEMPKASNSIPAFIVKHTEKIPSTGKQRTSKGIIYALLSPSTGTVEHIKVRSKNIEGGGGRDKMENYILECARDNNERGSIPFYEFVKMHKEAFKKNLQKYIDLVIKKINTGKYEKFNDYPVQVAKTLRRESKGILRPDISRLDIPDA